MPSAGAPSASLYIQPQIRHIQVVESLIFLKPCHRMITLYRCRSIPPKELRQPLNEQTHDRCFRFAAQAAQQTGHEHDRAPANAAMRHCDSTDLRNQALKTAFCLKTAIFETFQSISHQPGRVTGSHLVMLVRKDQAVILSSLNPIFIPCNSARGNPNTSANPQHLALLPVLLGILPLPGLPPFPFDFWNPGISIRRLTEVLTKDSFV